MSAEPEPPARVPRGSGLSIGPGGDIVLLPPLAFALSLAAGGLASAALANAGVSVGWLPPAIEPFRTPLFVACLPAVLSLEWAAFQGLKTQGTEPQFTPVNGLATSGIYAVTRNPMYVGLVLLALAIAELNDSAPLLASTALLAGYLHFGVILPEERLLTRIFGAEYVAFTKRTPRWLLV
jgi:protein-S-isoprenylcysteine O-methyltransferase Ste14